MKRLYDVYENNLQEVGAFNFSRGNQSFTLLPTSHVTQNAQIEVVLDSEGKFYDAEVVSKERTSTIVPATLDSANRSGAKIAAHYIHDKLFYVAGDYMKYGGEEKRSRNFEQYITQMKDWTMSQFSHEKLKLIYEYVKAGTVIEDLIEAKVLFTDEHDQLIEKWTAADDKKYGRDKPQIYKEVTGKSSDAFVRFTVLGKTPDDPVVWEDKTLFETFQKYLSERMAEEVPSGFCYVTGLQMPITERHGSRLRNAGDMSKLISSNDTRGFTYRGRFERPNQAVQIGYDVSQKAHNALRWLIQKQGFRVDTRNFVTFGVEKPADIQAFDGTMDLVDEQQLLAALFEETEVKSSEDTSTLLIAEQVYKAFKGKKHNFKLKGIENIIVMAVDAATTGRLAIVYYQELESQLFLDALENWHMTCKWYQSYYSKENKKLVNYKGTPSTYQIVEAVYGEKTDVRVKKELYTRLLPCIVEGAPIPKDVIRLIFNRVKNPMSFQRNLSNPVGEWQRTLNIACALIHRQNQKGALEVGLDIHNDSRDYLFGRLLGVAEAFEASELKTREDSRTTNAMRYFNAFTQHPARVWMTIQKQLQPYKVKPSTYSQRYIKLLQEIESKMKVEDMTNKALGPEFLLGYSSQIQDFYIKKEEKEENSNDINSK